MGHRSIRHDFAGRQDRVHLRNDDSGPGAPASGRGRQPGDLWVLRNHRLLCGDSTRIADAHRGRNGKAAAHVESTGERPNDPDKD